MRRLPFHHTAQNQIWLEIVQIALDLLAWMPMLAFAGPIRRWEVKRLRLRLLSAAAQLVTTGRRRILRLAQHWPWTELIINALTRLQTLPTPADLHIPVPASSTIHPKPWTGRQPDATAGPPA